MEGEGLDVELCLGLWESCRCRGLGWYHCELELCQGLVLLSVCRQIYWYPPLLLPLSAPRTSGGRLCVSGFNFIVHKISSCYSLADMVVSWRMFCIHLYPQTKALCVTLFHLPHCFYFIRESKLNWIKMYFFSCLAGVLIVKYKCNSVFSLSFSFPFPIRPGFVFWWLWYLCVILSASLL